jgi:hypothetical protein
MTRRLRLYRVLGCHLFLKWPQRVKADMQLGHDLPAPRERRAIPYSSISFRTAGDLEPYRVAIVTVESLASL